MTITQEQITKFFKKHFTDFRQEIEDGELIALVQDENLDDEDNDVIDYLEFKGISYSNEEILKMLDS